MPLFRSSVQIGILLSAILVLGACERKITRVEEIVSPASCFGCHSDNNTALVAAEQQWMRSKHASGENLNRNTTPCAGCHTSEGFVARITTGQTPAVVNNPTPIHCFTCHAPHSNGDFRLRVTAAPALQNGVSYDLGAGNLCVSCHQSRRNVNTYVVTPNDTVIFDRSTWGPHPSPQGDMLIGSNGYEFSGYTYDITNHRGATGAVSDKDGCLECHFKTTRNLVVGGHSFNMEYDEDGTVIRNTAACAPCHGSLTNFNYANTQTTVDAQLAILKNLLMSANLIDATDHVKAPRVVASSDSAGAVWNYLIVLEDRSRGIHNREYILGLLNSSIQFMGGTLAPPGPSVARED